MTTNSTPPSGRPKVIVVLGMHRSGTSAITRVVNLLGADISKKLMPPAAENVTGFWEPADVFLLNEQILDLAGSAWDLPNRLPDNFWVEPSIAEVASQMSALVAKDLEGTQLFVIKDPRICRLLPLWIRIFKQLDREPVFVLPLRNPLAVAGSLGRRNRTENSESLFLWMRYELEAEYYSRGFKRCFSSYEKFLKNWRFEVDRIAQSCDVRWPRAPETAAPEIESFLRKELQHHWFVDHDVDIHKDVNSLVKKTYRLFLDAEAGRVDENRFDSARASLNEIAEIIDPLLAAARRRQIAAHNDFQTLQKNMRELGARTTEQVAAIQQALENLRLQLSAETNERLRIETELGKSETRHREKDVLIVDLRKKIETRAIASRIARQQLSENTQFRHDLEATPLWPWFQKANALATRVESVRKKVRKARRLAQALPLLKIRHERRRQKEVERIRSSGLFDFDFYYQRYEDVRDSALDPVEHYVYCGASEGRDPHPLFSTRYYLENYEDVRSSDVNPFAHYLEFGNSDRRNPSAHFDTDYYLTNNPDVLENGVQPLWHFLHHGAAEGRNPSSRFDTLFYLENNEDVDQRGSNPLIHYLQFGKQEKRPSRGVETWSEQSDNFQALDNMSDTEMVADIRDLVKHPVFSILVPTYNTSPRLLEQLYTSVRNQVYEQWELIFSDDGSTNPATKTVLRQLQNDDHRVRCIFSETNHGISAATNLALKEASGEFIALLDHDDELTNDALFWMVKEINEKPELDVIYSDQDKIDENGRRYEPFFKPDWSPELFLGVMYVGHLLVVRKSLAERVGGFDSRFDKIQDYEFMLRLSEQTFNIGHIPRILYHWRAIAGSVARGNHEKSGIDELQTQAVNAALKRRQLLAIAEPHAQLSHRVTIRPSKTHSSRFFSIIIPSKDAPHHIGRCLESLFAKTKFKNFEVIVVDNNTTDPQALAVLKNYPIKIVPYKEAFCFSRANNLGVAEAKGDALVLLNNDTEILTPQWLEVFDYHLDQNDVGAVGPLLLYPDNTVQHAGVVLGFRGTADHVMRGFPPSVDGYAGSLSCARDVSAVTAACLAVTKENYEKVGGLQEDYQIIYQDVDFCLRLRHAGLRNIFTPQASLYHHESQSRGKAYNFVDRALLLDCWQEVIENGDPYYNPNFSIRHVDYQLKTGR